MAGFTLFGEPLWGEADPGSDVLAERHMGAPHLYERFLAARRARGNVDVYAAFQPFNESTRALFALLPLLREALAPGDLILDLWGRTGYSGELLAALFPEQRVVSMWEGDSGVLGYRGYRHWLGLGARRDNHDVVFHSPEKPLPFATDAFALVHGLDTLHRYAPQPFLAECLRVCQPAGTLVFPHVHLANGEPDPYFDRGGRIVHGRHYRAHFDRLLAGTSRAAWVLSEAALFERPGMLTDDADTTHYNGLVLIGDRAWEGRPLTRSEPVTSDARLLPNPAVRVCTVGGDVALDPDLLSGGAGHFLDRHPLYRRHLETVLPERLSLRQRQVLYWAERGLTAEAIAARLGLDWPTLNGEIEAMADADIVQAQPVTAAVAALHASHMAKGPIGAPENDTFAALWTAAADRFGERPLLESADGGDRFSHTDATAVLDALSVYLSGRGIQAGHRVAVLSAPHTEYVLLAWACLRIGVVLVPLDPSAPEETTRSVLGRVAPQLLVVDEARLPFARSAPWPWIVFDGEGAAATAPEAFAEVLQSAFGQSPPSVVAPASHDVAVILFTSGTTAAPKGVRLTQGALCRSGVLLREAAGLDENDRLLSLGGYHAMSGFRNPCIAALQGGATVIVPAPDERHPTAVAARCAEAGVTVVSTVPGFLSGLLERPQGASLPDGHRLRLLLVTGARLHAGVVEAFETQTRVPVLDYFGLTETCGICSIAAPGTARGDGHLGRPVGALLAIVDDLGQPVGEGEVGRLWVYSDNLMAGYLDDVAGAGVTFEQGWLVTGDMAVVREAEVVLLGRNDERIKTANGDVVYPSELADALSRHPDVGEAAVVAYVDSLGHAQLAGFIVARDPLADPGRLLSELRSYLAGRCGAQKVPRCLRLATALPRSSNGKIVKDALLKVIDHETFSASF